MLERLRQSDLDDLSAWLDGELPPERAEEIRRLAETDPLWRQEAAGLRAVDAALDNLPASPPPNAALADRILAAASEARPGDTKLRPVLRLAAWLAPVAALAACVLLAMHFMVAPSSTPAGPDVRQAVSVEADDPAVLDLPEVDRFAVENWDFVRDIDVVENLDTLQAIVDLEHRG